MSGRLGVVLAVVGCIGLEVRRGLVEAHMKSLEGRYNYMEGERKKLNARDAFNPVIMLNDINLWRDKGDSTRKSSVLHQTVSEFLAQPSSASLVAKR